MLGRARAVFAAGAILLLGLPLGVGAARQVAPAPLPDAHEPVVLGRYLEKFIDQSRDLGLNEIRSEAAAGRFEPNQDRFLNIGQSDAALWLRFRVAERPPSSGPLLLEIRFPVLDRIEYYAPESDGRGGITYRKAVVGDTLPWRVREVKDRNYVFRLPQHGENDIYLRVVNAGAMFVPAFLWDADAFSAHRRNSDLVFGAFYGVVFALILYNLMLFLSVRDVVYLYYALYGTTFGGTLAAVDGFFFEYLGPEGGWWPNNGLAVFLFLALLFGTSFTRRFLDTPRIAPWQDRMLLSIGWTSGILSAFAATGWFVPYGLNLAIASVLGMLIALIVIVTAVRALISGNRIARYFLLAWATLLTGLIVFPLRHWAIVPYTFYTFYSLHIGLALDLLLLSFALGDRINILGRQTERARSEARAMEIASRHKSEFLASMSHELRTPLNAILGFSEMLHERVFGALNEKQTEYVKDIRQAGSHLLALVNDILDLSKVEAGRMELDLADVDLRSVIDSAVHLLRERALRHGIALEARVDDSIGTVRADERKVKQILLNFLSNALKFTPDGGRIGVAARQAGQFVEVAVSDTGVGISPEDQKLVFEEFKQVGTDAVRKAEGTGLGLALTKRFVELHGGAVRLESEPGKGSTFFFTLPTAAIAKPG